MSGWMRVLVSLTAAVLLCVVSCAGSRLGGSTGASAAGSVTISYGRWGSADEIAADKILLNAFHASHRTVAVQSQVSDWDTYWTKLPTQLAAGQAPDAFLMSPGLYQAHYAEAGKLLALDSLIKQSHINLRQYWPQELSTMQFRGHYYELPRDISTMMIVWNKSMFERAGVKQPPFTWQELLHDAQLMTLDSKGRNATQNGFDPNTIKQWGYASYEYLDGIEEPLITEMGGHLWSQPETSPHVTSLVDSAQSRKAIQFLVDLIYRYHVSPNPTQLGHYQNMFASGKVAMYPDGTYDLPVYEAIKRFKWDVVPFPSWNGRPATIAQGVGNAVNAASSHRAQAWQLVDWLSSPSGQKVMSSHGINIPAIRSMALSPSFLKGKPAGMKRVLASIKYGVPNIDFPNKADAFNYAETIISNEIFTGRVSVAAGLAKAARGANLLLQGRHP